MNKPDNITYYLIGNWMGYFRTKSSTKTHEEFESYLKKHDFERKGNTIYDKGELRGVIESENGKELPRDKGFNPGPVVCSKS